MSWEEAIKEEWKRRQSQSNEVGGFPLVFQNFNEQEILDMVEVVLSGQLTMSSRVRRFEAEFAKHVGAPFALMVNSGSSANLLAFAALVNPLRANPLKAGDEVIVPAVCWSTSVWPIMQMGLTPVFADVNPETLNMDLDSLKKVMTTKTKAVLAVHILGNSTDMARLREFCEANSLMLVEDTCESLGSKAGNQYLGTLGAFGTYSFYFSHHMTTGEGGMVVCQTQEDYDLIRSLRAHGWSRELSNREELEAKYPDIDPRFLFVNMGFNLRPMEIQAALGLQQLSRLAEMNQNRIDNNQKIVEALESNPAWDGQYEFVRAERGTSPVWFGFCLLVSQKYSDKKSQLLTYLTEKGVENRPIVSGNFARQPAFQLFGVKVDPELFVGAEEIHRRGFFIGIHTEPLTQQQVSALVEILLGFDF